MVIRDIKECEEIQAGDETTLCEILHPGKGEFRLRYSLAHALLKPGCSSLAHRLRTSEVYFILEGDGIMYMDDESEEVHPGQAVYIPPNSIQYIKNIGNKDLRFLCIVDPAWRAEDEEVMRY